jgi:uncharacterized protein with NRDE domain
MYIKTVKTLKKELAKIEKNLSEHQESCVICNYPASCEEDYIECDGFNFIYSEHESTIHEIEEAEQCFQQELKDRNISLSASQTDNSNSVIVHITQDYWETTLIASNNKISEKHIRTYLGSESKGQTIYDQYPCNVSEKIRDIGFGIFEIMNSLKEQ